MEIEEFDKKTELTNPLALSIMVRMAYLSWKTYSEKYKEKN